jgi:hypothetical protein
VGFFRGGEVQRSLLVRNEEAITGELVVESRSQKGFERLTEASIYLSVENAVASIDEPAGITE